MAAEFFMLVFHFFVLSAARNTMFQGANRSEKREDILDILPCPDKKSGSKLANEPLPPKGGNGFTTESVRNNKFYSDIKDVDKTDFYKSVVSFVKQIVQHFRVSFPFSERQIRAKTLFTLLFYFASCITNPTCDIIFA